MTRSLLGQVATSTWNGYFFCCCKIEENKLDWRGFSLRQCHAVRPCRAVRHVIQCAHYSRSMWLAVGGHFKSDFTGSTCDLDPTWRRSVFDYLIGWKFKCQKRRHVETNNNYVRCCLGQYWIEMLTKASSKRREIGVHFEEKKRERKKLKLVSRYVCNLLTNLGS